MKKVLVSLGDYISLFSFDGKTTDDKPPDCLCSDCTNYLIFKTWFDAQPPVIEAVYSINRERVDLELEIGVTTKMEMKMTIEEIEEQLERLLFLEGDCATAVCNGGASIYQEKECIESRAKLLEAIKQYVSLQREEAFDMGYSNGAKINDN